VRERKFSRSMLCIDLAKPLRSRPCLRLITPLQRGRVIDYCMISEYRTAVNSSSGLTWSKRYDTAGGPVTTPRSMATGRPARPGQRGGGPATGPEQTATVPVPANYLAATGTARRPGGLRSRRMTLSSPLAHRDGEARHAVSVGPGVRRRDHDLEDRPGGDRGRYGAGDRPVVRAGDPADGQPGRQPGRRVGQ